MTQLLQHYDWALRQLRKNLHVDIIYIDFAKAFNNVVHGRICYKLRDLGIAGNLENDYMTF